jgi:ArsR family transcriptional regulator, cadmium/lead-responsive transcriptional repressor
LPDVNAVFAALADPTRREVIERMAGTETTTATKLATDLPISRQAVAKHLAALSAAELVQAERAGRETRYRLTPQPFADAMEWMAHVGGRWDERLQALQRHLERLPAGTQGAGRENPREELRRARRRRA